MNVLQQLTWNGNPLDLGDAWHLQKGTRRAVCRLFTHQFGWDFSEEITRTEVCRAQDDVLTTYESWKAAMQNVGWT